MKSTTAAAALLFMLPTTTCWAQASEAEMRAFPMPPPGIAAVSTWATEPYYGYFTAPSTSLSTPGAGGAGDYSYVLYTGNGLHGTTGVFWGDWGTTPVPPPSSGGDNCGHSHVSYGVWGYVQRQIDILWIHNVTYEWTFLGGGGLSGTRDASGRCVHNTTVGAGWSPDGRFGWGQSAMAFDLHQPLHPVWYETDIYLHIVVGVLNATHGWGSCGAFACIEPGYILGYAVP
jgi:hypothetical protein